MWHWKVLMCWWVRPDLNQRPRHLQCRALPTKLLTRARLANALAISSLPMERLAPRWTLTMVDASLCSFKGFPLEGKQRFESFVSAGEQGC